MGVDFMNPLLKGERSNKTWPRETSGVASSRMDSLKAVGHAIKNSPKAIRKKISGESVAARHDSK